MGSCFRPFFRKNEKGQDRLVPCGRCPKCKARRVSEWSFRLQQHERKSISAHFITLTYNDENLPITRNGYRSLRKKDLQLFFKRLRKRHGASASDPEAPIRYFAVGEYGGKIGRPHYHVILFNADIRLIQDSWCYSTWKRHVVARKRGLNKNGLRYAIHHSKKWHHSGFIHYGDQRGVNGASIGYCLKYCLKPRDKKEYYIDAEPEFAIMSKGLGLDYITPQMVKWHRADLKNRMYVNLEDGKKATMPRYYKDRIYSKVEREEIADHSRNKFAEDILKDLFVLYNNDPDYVGSYQKVIWNKKQAEEAAYRKQSSLTNKAKCYV